MDLSGFVSSDNQNIENLGLAGNILTVGIEDGTSQTVDLSYLDNSGTDDQALSLSGNTLTLEDGGTVDLSPYLDDTDNQTVTDFNLAVGDILTITLEDGNTRTVDLSSLNNSGTDDQTAAEVNYDNTVSGLAAAEVQSAIDELAAGSTDDQNISGSGLSGTDLTIGIENGTNEVVDLSSLVGTDDQDLSTDGTAGNISIEDGNSISLNVNDADSDPGNEYNTAIGTTTGNLEITDNGGTLSTSLISSDANNDLAAGTDGALYLNVASVTISETITNLTDTNDGFVTYTNESGAAQKVAKANITDNGNGTYTFTNNDGSDVLLDTRASSNLYDNTTSGLTATDTQAALDELSAGSTDDQNLTLSGTDLSIEDGNSVDLSGFVSSDDQALSLSGNTLTLEDGGTVDLSSYLDNTDDQAITDFSLDGTTNILTLTLEDGGTQTVDLSGFVSTDDQQLTLAANTLALEDGGTVDLIGYLDNTDDQNIENLGLAGNILTVGIEGGTAQTVDLSALDNSGTDDQNISGSGLSGTDLTIGIENGTNETVDLSSLVGTDDQTISLSGNTLTLEDGGTVDLSPYLDNTDDQAITDFSLDGTTNILTLTLEDGGTQTVDLSGFVSTDNQNISGSGLSGTDLTIGIENGTSETVDLSSLVGTDDQQLTLATNTLTLEDGGTVDLSGYLDNTDAQNISGSGLSGTDLTIGIENGTNETVDLSSLVGTDDQALSLSGNTLTLEDGGTVDLSGYLDNTDDQAITEFSLDGTTNILTLTLEDGGTQTVDLSGFVSSDDQNIENLGLAGNILTVGIEGGTAQTVDLSALDNSGTDDQNISGSGLSGTDLTIGIENGTSETVDLSSLVGTDDQGLSLSGNTLTLEDGGTVDLSGFVSTDDQALSLSGNTLTLEDGGTVDLSGYLDNTDDQNIENLGLAGNILTVGIEGGTAQTVDLSALDNSGTDDQNLAGASLNASNILQIDIEDGTSATVDLSALNDSGTDDQALSLSGNTLTLEDGGTVDLAPYLDNTDDQAITDFSLDGTTNILTLTLEDGGTQTVDLSGFVSSDDQNIENLGLAGNILTVGIEGGTAQTVDLSALDNSGSDDQNISGSGLSGTDLTIGIENGTNETVDLSSLVGTDNQQLTLATNTLALEDGGTVDLSGYLDNTDDQALSLSGNTLALEDGGTVDLIGYLDNTDDQNIENLGLAGNILTVGIEGGTAQTVDLSALDNSGSDDQNISGSGLSGTDLTIGIENGTSETVDLSSLVGTDDQAISLAGNTLALEDGGTVDLSGYLDNTDDQNIENLGLAGTTSDGGHRERHRTNGRLGFLGYRYRRTGPDRGEPDRQHAADRYRERIFRYGRPVRIERQRYRRPKNRYFYAYRNHLKPIGGR